MRHPLWGLRARRWSFPANVPAAIRQTILVQHPRQPDSARVCWPAGSTPRKSIDVLRIRGQPLPGCVLLAARKAGGCRPRPLTSYRYHSTQPAVVVTRVRSVPAASWPVGWRRAPRLTATLWSVRLLAGSSTHRIDQCCKRTTRRTVHQLQSHRGWDQTAPAPTLRRPAWWQDQVAVKQPRVCSEKQTLPERADCGSGL